MKLKEAAVQNNKFGKKEKGRILVVNNDPQALPRIFSVLKDSFRVVVAETCFSGWELANKNQPDLILIDINMPDYCGLELCRQLKKQGTTQQIPVIFLTANTNDEYFARTFEAGGSDLVHFPFKAAELLARINNQLAMRLKEQQLRQVIDLVPHRLFAKDAAGNIVLANKAAAAFYNTPADQILNQPEPELPAGFKYEAIANKDTFPSKAEPKSLITFEERLHYPDGSHRYYQTNVLPFTFSGTSLPAVLEIAMDVTTLIEKQEEINRLNEKLQQHNNYKDKLLSVIAHDLVNLIFNNALVMRSIIRNGHTLSKEEILKRVEKTKDNNKSIQDLLQNLLMWALAQFNAVSFNPANLQLESELLKVTENLHLQAFNKGIELKLDIPENYLIKADANMLQTILRNLISNAIKFTDGAKTITISATKKGKKVFLAVTDQGTGMKPARIRQILGGNQEESCDPAFGTNGEKGSGLGLQLCKDFIKQHGGKLQIKSRLGRGSTFSFSVPVVKA
ncbi:MAG TPA: ATP-binding protein [Adhaeribacter sp.]|nr:ATP-binding protein [Adhaeribacter sp.]